MSKKQKSNKEKPLSIATRKLINLPPDLLKAMFGNWRMNRHFLDQVGSPPGPTKTWLKEASSRPCIHNKLPLQHPQVLTELLTTDSSYHSGYWSHRYRYVIVEKQWCQDNNKGILTLTYKVSKAHVRHYCTCEKRSIKHEIMIVDRYDSDNGVVKFTNVVECDRKFYALSLQGSLFVMEEKKDKRLVVTGICKTRVVPSCSVRAKFYDEYMIESRGEVFLVFLIYRETIGVVNDIEVFRVDIADGVKLVKADKLGGRTLILEKEYCMWIDSREIDCKGDCVYFFNTDKWFMYDLKSKSISMDETMEQWSIAS